MEHSWPGVSCVCVCVLLGWVEGCLCRGLKSLLGRPGQSPQSPGSSWGSPPCPDTSSFFPIQRPPSLGGCSYSWQKGSNPLYPVDVPCSGEGRTQIDIW